MPRRVWTLIAISVDRQYGGNAGYADDPERSYSYDSAVANSRQLAVGDVVFVRDQTAFVGASIVERIDRSTGFKDRFKCPTCGASGIKQRKHSSPRWRCRDGHEFDTPVHEKVTVDLFAAFYAKNFVKAYAAIPVQTLKLAALRPNAQLSIEEVSLERLAPRISATPALADFVTQVLETVAPEDLTTPLVTDTDNYFPSDVDNRLIALRAIRARQGQQKFREKLLGAYGPACMVSGCATIEVVEAAHIWPYRGEHDHAIQNGLLLRSDIHTLFDLHRLGFNPETLELQLHPSLLVSQYSGLKGARLALHGNHRPSTTALKRRWDFFHQQAVVV